MNATKTIAKATARRVLNWTMLLASFGIVSHIMPMEMTMVAPEHGAAHAADVSKSDKAFERAMKKCETLPEGTMPGAAVVDFTGALPKYTTNPKEVTIAFEYGVSSYMKEAHIAHDAKVEGVTLCK